MNHEINPIPWDQFVAEIMPTWEPPLVSQSRRRAVAKVCDEMTALGVASTADLTPGLIARYLESRPPGESPYTLHSRLMTLKTLTGEAVERGYLARCPFARRQIRHLVHLGDPRDERVLTRDEVRRLFEVLTGDVGRKRGWAAWKARRLHAAVAVAVYTGVRRDELFRLWVADIDLAARVIRLTPHGKRFKTSASAKPVGIPAALVPILEGWLDHRLDAPAGFPIDQACPWLLPTCSRRGPWLNGRTKRRPLGRLQAAGRRAGIPDVNWQILRRTCATMMEAAGASDAQIQRQLRHTSSAVTRKWYRKADEQAIADAIEGLSF